MATQRRSTAKVLVVDDELDVCDTLQAVLEEEGYDVQGAGDGQAGLKSFYAWSPSVVILDVTMPKLDGWQVLTRIREVSDVPVIMLTARGLDQEKVRGLRGGADDYVVKPCTMDELLARVDAVLRRCDKGSASEAGRVYRDAALEVDHEAHKVSLFGKPVDLSPQEFRVLAALIARPGAVLSADQLLDLCWPEGEGGPESVRVYIGYLRKKLERDPRQPLLIETVREFGYRYHPQS